MLIGSTVNGVHPIGKASRFSRATKSRVDIEQPQAIKKYNEFMGGVDRMDQSIACYRTHIRSKKCWWAVFAMNLDAAIHTARQLYRTSAAARHHSLDHLAFKRTGTRSYLQQYARLRSCSARAAMYGPRRSITAEVCDEVRRCDIKHRQSSKPTLRRRRQYKRTPNGFVYDVAFHYKMHVF